MASYFDDILGETAPSSKKTSGTNRSSYFDSVLGEDATTPAPAPMPKPEPTKEPEMATALEIPKETKKESISFKFDDIFKLDAPEIKPVIGNGIQNMAMTGIGTTAMGQGVDVKIDKNAQIKFRTEENRKRETQKAKVVGLVKQNGFDALNKMSPEDKDLVLEGLQQEKGKQAFIRAATDADIPMWSIDPKDPNNFMTYEKNRDKIAGGAYDNAVDDPMENVSIGLKIGRDQVFNSIGKVQEWAYGGGKEVQKLSRMSMETESAKFNKPLEETDVADSRFWTQTVPQQIPFMLALAPAGVAGAMGGTAGAGALGLGEIGTYLTASFGAGVASRLTEGIVEGADTYSTLKSQGVDDKVANAQAWKTTRDNMALMFSDISQMAVTFAPIKGLSGIKKAFSVGGKFVFDAATEGGEEVWQGYVQQYHQNTGLGKTPMTAGEYIGTKEAQDSFIIGAATGFAFGSAGVVKDVWENLTNRTEAQIDLIDEAVANRDDSFPAKVDFLVENEAIQPETGDAIKEMFDTRLQETQGITTEELVVQKKEEQVTKIAQLSEKIDQSRQATIRKFENFATKFRNGKTTMVDTETGAAPKEFTSEMASVLSDVTRTIAHTNKNGWWDSEVGSGRPEGRSEGLEGLKELLLESKRPPSANENVNRNNDIIDTMVAIIDGQKLPKKEKAVSEVPVEQEKVQNVEKTDEEIIGDYFKSHEYPSENGLDLWLQSNFPKERRSEILRKYNETYAKKEANSEQASVGTDRIAQATELGKTAYGKYASFAQDPRAQSLLEGLAVGEGKPILEAYAKAWNDEYTRVTDLELKDKGIVGNATGKEIEKLEKKDTIASNKQNQPTDGNGPRAVSDTGNVPTGTDGEGGTKTDIPETGGRGDTSVEQSGNRPADGKGTSDRKPVGKATRAQINDQVRALVTGKGFSTKASDYTSDEISLMREYTGAGGKADKGAVGRGLLDEYYTPVTIVKSMWDIARKLVPEGTVLEPSAGIGRFIENAPKGYSISGRELDQLSGTIAQVLNPDASITIGDFQEQFIDKSGKKLNPDKKYDIVIGNPPYGERSGFYKGLGEEKNIAKWDEYFLKRGIDLLNDGGVLVYIIPSSFLENGISKAKLEISKQATMLSAYRLPEGMFEDTTIGTDVVVFQKGKDSAAQDISNGEYFSKNPENILGDVIERKNRFAKMEEVVVGNKERAIEKMETLVNEIKESEPSNKNKVKNPTTEATPEVKPKPQSNKNPKERAKKVPTKVVDVSGIPTVEYQILNAGEVTQSELDIFKSQLPNGSVPYKEEWAEYLNFQNGLHYHDINYFSGDIREKLADLEKDKKDITPEQYKKQKDGLDRILPNDKKINDITFDPMDRFITSEGTGKTSRMWSTKDREYVQTENTVLDAFQSWLHDLNYKLIGHNVEKGDVRRFLAGDRQRAHTKEITGYIKSESKRLFNQFIKSALDVDVQARIMKKYNEQKNSYVRPDYDKIPVEIRGMATTYKGKPFALSETQRNGVGFLVNRGSGLIAYGVGVGKTHALLVATIANMQKGWSKRPLFVVPASTMKTWVETTQQMFPGVKINDLSGLQAPVIARLKKKGDVSSWVNDGEISFISHEGILKLGFSEEEIFEATKDLQDALGSFDSKMSPREMEKSKEKTMQVLGEALKGSTDISLSTLGFDHISVDEVHNFRKIFQGAKVEGEEGEAQGKRRFANVMGGTPSARARKLFLISQHIQKNNGGRNVFLASATPFENHATEVYNILSLMARDSLKNAGIYNINDFYATFADFKTESVQSVSGESKDKEIMMGFSNLPELQSLLKQFIDKKEDNTLVRPDKVVISPQLKMSPLQEEAKAQIREALKSDDPGALLVATTQMKANSFSPYFTKYVGEPSSAKEFVKNSPKIEYAMEMLRMLRTDPKTKDRSNFMYIGAEGIQFTNLYVEYLTENVGYKSSEIGVITGDVTDEAREKIKDKFNKGEIKVLIGGVPTKEGINLQDNGYATFNLALGWNPTEMAQVEGRVWRQGNNLNKALIIYPIVENSGDINIFQKFQEKASRINDLFSYDGPVFDVGEIDPKEKKLMLLTDPTEKANLYIRIDEQKLAQENLYLQSDLSELEKATAEMASNKSGISRNEESIERYKDTIKRYEDTPDSWDFRNATSNLEESTKRLKELKAKNKGIEARLQNRGITDPNAKIAELKESISKNETARSEIKLTFAGLLEKYEKEYEENLKNTKSISDHVKDIQAINKTLVVQTQEELQAQKTRLVAKSVSKKESSGPDAYELPKVRRQNVEPNIKSGYVRFYRGHVGNFDPERINEKSDSSRWFSTDREWAEFYAGESGDVYYVDVPKDTEKSFMEPDSMLGEKSRFLPVEIAKKAKPFPKGNNMPDDYGIPDKVSKINPAKTTDEFKGRIEQLNKFAMGRGIMRKVGGVTKASAGGQFLKEGTYGVTTEGEVRIRKDVPMDDKTYMSVLAHELGHALEYRMTGTTNKDTYTVFKKDVTEQEKATLRAELIANTKEMVGEAAYNENPKYYGKDTELLARFLERHFTEPLLLEKVAPTAAEMFMKNAVNSPIISEYLQAVTGTIDELQLKFPKFFNFILDQRQQFQAMLGERAGNRAYNTIVRRTALQARAKSVFEKELKAKFKGIKDTEGVFQAIEATLRTEGGVPVFGTRDFLDVPDGEVIDREDAGWALVYDDEGNVMSKDGKTRMSIDRYTASEGKEIYDSLSEKEKEFVRDFTAIKDEAKDFINREVIKDAYGIQSDMEGWIHHFWEDSLFGVGKTKLKTKVASARKKRTGSAGYVEDAQKALYKSLTELEGAKIFNDWLNEFIPTVTKPLAEGQAPDEGWMEVTGDFIKGFIKKGDIQEFVIKDGQRFKVNKSRYQIPTEIYNRFGKIADFTQEAGTAYATLELIAKAWQVNILAHPGTAATNAIGGGLQFSLKMFTDVYKSILTGDPSIIGNDIKALVGSLTNWNDVPDWMFGNDSSTYMRDASGKKYKGKMRIIHQRFDQGANVVMKPFQFFESYWKKVIARASGARGLSELNRLTKDGLPPLSEDDKVILDMIEQASDLYGFNYNNVPNWMHELSTNPVGKLTLPFKRYLYKYVKMLTHHLFSIANRNMPWQDRLAMFMGLATFMGVIAAIINSGDDDRETPEDITTNTPKWMNPTGKMYTGKDENGLEKFVRTVKYPGFNLYAFTRGDIMQGFGDMTEGASSVGPLGQVVLHQIGYKNQYEQYKETSQLHASTLSSFTPGFRVLADISQILDPFKRKTTSPLQEFTRLIPTTDKEEQDRLHGKIYADRVPIGKNSTTDVERKNFPEDTLKSLFTGIYTSRIDPNAVKAYEDRDKTNEEKAKAKDAWDVRKKEVIDKYVKLYNESNDFRKGAYMERNMQVELFGKGKLTKSEVGQFNSVKEDFRLARSNDPFVKKLADFNTNDERATVIKALKENGGMKQEEWKRYVGKLFREGAISEQLFKSLFSK